MIESYFLVIYDAIYTDLLRICSDAGSERYRRGIEGVSKEYTSKYKLTAFEIA